MTACIPVVISSTNECLGYWTKSSKNNWIFRMTIAYLAITILVSPGL